jgi:hypothetical protein
MRMTLGEDDVNNNKSRLKDIILSIQYSKGKGCFGLLAATMILPVAISGEYSLTSSKAYAEGQIYEMKVQHNPILLTSISAVEQQGTQQPTRNQTEMQQLSSTQNATIHDFENAFVEIVNDTRSLSIAYQDEIAKLESGVYDNETFVTITDLYLQMYQELLARADALRQWPSTLPINYSRAIELYSESIRTEMMSQEHFRNYLSTGDMSENEKSLELLSESLRFEIEAFNAFRSVANDTAIQNGTDSSINNATDAIIGI